jgi:hypothetical protein
MQEILSHLAREKFSDERSVPVLTFLFTPRSKSWYLPSRQQLKLMKTTLTMLGALACCAVFSAAYAGEVSQSSSRRTRVSPDREYVYISNEVPTGSHVPAVLRVYRGTLTSASAASPLAVYNRRSLDISGSDDVATALYKLDPSIGTTRGRFR